MCSFVMFARDKATRSAVMAGEFKKRKSQWWFKLHVKIGHRKVTKTKLPVGNKDVN